MLNRLFFPGVSSDCPFRNSSIPNNTCLSSNDCNVCKRINGVHEGCDHPFDTTSPVCDADKSNVGIDATARGISECVGCKRSGNRLVDKIKLVKIFCLDSHHVIYCQSIRPRVDDFLLDGVGGESGNGGDIGNCPRPTSYPAADATMDPNPEIYNAINVPNSLKCFNSGECHVCKPGNQIALDNNFNCPNVGILVLTRINGESKNFCKRTTNKNTVSIPMNPTPSTINPTSFTSTDVSNGCVVSNDENSISGVMQTCRETTKTDSVKYNQCQACSESYPFD